MVVPINPWGNSWGKAFKPQWTPAPPPPTPPPPGSGEIANPWGDSWGNAFREIWTPAPSPDSGELPQYAGWASENILPVAMICDLLGRPIAELPLTQWDVIDGLSRPTEATFTTNATTSTQLSKLLQPWKNSIVFLVEGKPVWGGTVVNSQAALGKTSIAFTAREWSAWLDRVWTTEAIEYISPAIQVDVGEAIRSRIVSAATLAVGYGVKPPLDGLRWSGPAGVLAADMDFLSQEEVSSPQKILDEITTLAQSAGIDWQLDWVEEGERFYPKLKTFKYIPDVAPVYREIVVGTDCATALLEVNSDSQANRLKIVGKEDFYIHPSGVSHDLNFPPLWRAISYDRVVNPELLANQLWPLLNAPAFVASDISIPGSRNEWSPGDIVRLVVPSDFDPRYPEGLRVTLRVMEVHWLGDASSRSTSLTLASLFNQDTLRGDVTGRTLEPPSPTIGRITFPEAIRSLKSRIIALELQRPPTLRNLRGTHGTDS